MSTLRPVRSARDLHFDLSCGCISSVNPAFTSRAHQINSCLALIGWRYWRETASLRQCAKRVVAWTSMRNLERLSTIPPTHQMGTGVQPPGSQLTSQTSWARKLTIRPAFLACQPCAVGDHGSRWPTCRGLTESGSASIGGLLSEGAVIRSTPVVFVPVLDRPIGIGVEAVVIGADLRLDPARFIAQQQFPS